VGLGSLGETVTEIRAGVTYRYYVSFNDPWDIDVSDHTCMVKAPALRPSLPPAIHTDTMEKRIERGWFRFDAERQMADLEKAITPTLVEYASDPRHLNLVRETARKTVAEFVRRWLLKEDHWRARSFPGNHSHLCRRRNIRPYLGRPDTSVDQLMAPREDASRKVNECLSLTGAAKSTSYGLSVTRQLTARR